MHGIGADAFDLIPLAKYWSTKLNKTQFYSLNAPFFYALGPSGRQWFSLEDRDQTRILSEIDHIKPMIINFLEKKKKSIYTLRVFVTAAFSSFRTSRNRTSPRAPQPWSF